MGTTHYNDGDSLCGKMESTSKDIAPKIDYSLKQSVYVEFKNINFNFQNLVLLSSPFEHKKERFDDFGVAKTHR